MQTEHERSLERLARVKDLELDAVLRARDHTKYHTTASSPLSICLNFNPLTDEQRF